MKIQHQDDDDAADQISPVYRCSLLVLRTFFLSGSCYSSSIEWNSRGGWRWWGKKSRKWAKRWRNKRGANGSGREEITRDDDDDDAGSGNSMRRVRIEWIEKGEDERRTRVEIFFHDWNQTGIWVDSGIQKVLLLLIFSSFFSHRVYQGSSQLFSLFSPAVIIFSQFWCFFLCASESAFAISSLSLSLEFQPRLNEIASDFLHSTILLVRALEMKRWDDEGKVGKIWWSSECLSIQTSERKKEWEMESDSGMTEKIREERHGTRWEQDTNRSERSSRRLLKGLEIIEIGCLLCMYVGCMSHPQNISILSHIRLGLSSVMVYYH